MSINNLFKSIKSLITNKTKKRPKTNITNNRPKTNITKNRNVKKPRTTRKRRRVKGGMIEEEYDYSDEIDEDGSLDLSNHNLTEVPSNLPMNSIIYLNLNNNNISKIKNIPLSVEHLDLRNNNISKIVDIPVTTLDLSNNKITLFKNISPTITHLSLNNNRIREFIKRNVSYNMEHIQLRHNPLSERSLEVINRLNNPDNQEVHPIHIDI